MPNVSLDRLRQVASLGRSVASSGYPESAARRIEGEARWTAWLQKPFTPDGLMRKVRDCFTS